MAFCESYLGCPPYFPLWLALFHGRVSRAGKDDPVLTSGGVTFQIKGGAEFFKLELPKKASSSWREYWFYARENTPADEVAMPEYVAKPSSP